MSDLSERMLRAAMKDQYRDMQAEIERLRGLLTRIHGIAAEPRPVNMAVRLENIACIASGERDATSAQLAEAQRFSHSADVCPINMAEEWSELCSAGTCKVCRDRRATSTVPVSPEISTTAKGG